MSNPSQQQCLSLCNFRLRERHDQLLDQRSAEVLEIMKAVSAALPGYGVRDVRLDLANGGVLDIEKDSCTLDPRPLEKRLKNEWSLDGLSISYPVPRCPPSNTKLIAGFWTALGASATFGATTTSILDWQRPVSIVIASVAAIFTGLTVIVLRNVCKEDKRDKDAMHDGSVERRHDESLRNQIKGVISRDKSALELFQSLPELVRQHFESLRSAEAEQIRALGGTES